MKTIFNLLSKIAVLILTLFLSSCYYDDLVEQVIPPNNDVSFANDIQPIFNNNCIVCHPPVTQPDLTEGNSYTSLTSIPGGIIPGDAEGSELMEMLNHDPNNPNPMPPSSPMSATNINLIAAWINQGALNN